MHPITVTILNVTCLWPPWSSRAPECLRALGSDRQGVAIYRIDRI